ncbi:MAG: DUF1003 domain-containing protein [Candidatus Cloacimonadaceae bacterium]|nr:DUF1003 domain-containing protein [Candidatus Cloacimonadaceae bacterium]MDP3114356.1 DUF1003 domain-containing protein [Candidatus Cloacimonadaceae bacterium]
METYKEIIARLLHKEMESLTPSEKHVLQHLHENEAISQNTHAVFTEKLTFGQRTADKVAAFGGSWTFIGIFGAIIALWIGLNVYLLFIHKRPFDPFPYILLNLFLSMLAAIQAPVIMMSQNRQAAHDRLDARYDYEVNLKAEIEIVALHQKIDELRVQQWEALLKLQAEQITRLQKIEVALETENRSTNL